MSSQLHIEANRRNSRQSTGPSTVARFHPDAPDQPCLVDILVHSEWTLRRLCRGTKKLLSLQSDRLPTQPPAQPNPLPAAHPNWLRFVTFHIPTPPTRIPHPIP